MTKLLLSLVLTAFLASALSVMSVSAAPATGTGNTKTISITNPLNSNSIPGLISNIINWFLKIIGAIALGLFVYGGFTWLTAAGNDKKVAAGTDTLLWAGIGIVCVFLSYILVGYVLQVLGVI